MSADTYALIMHTDVQVAVRIARELAVTLRLAPESIRCIKPHAHAAWAEILRLKPLLLAVEAAALEKLGGTFLRMLRVAHPVPVIAFNYAAELSPAVTEAAEQGFCWPITATSAQPTMIVSQIARLLSSMDLSRLPLPAETVRANPLPSVSSPPLAVIAIGASAGGPEALGRVLAAFPDTCPGILVVQHMPERFTGPFAKRLHTLCRIEVREAEDGLRLTPGRAIIANGRLHLRLNRDRRGYFAETFNAPPVCGHRPAVDVLFRSVAAVAGKNAIGIMLTGMGSDGAEALLALRQAGGRTIVQDRDSCVVFGMPKEAIKIGAAETVVPLPEIARTALALAGAPASAATPGTKSDGK